MEGDVSLAHVFEKSMDIEFFSRFWLCFPSELFCTAKVTLPTL